MVLRRQLEYRPEVKQRYNVTSIDRAFLTQTVSNGSEVLALSVIGLLHAGRHLKLGRITTRGSVDLKDKTEIEEALPEFLHTVGIDEMPVTIKPSQHGANLVKIDPDALATSAQSILEDIIRKHAKPPRVRMEDGGPEDSADIDIWLDNYDRKRAEAQEQLKHAIASLELIQSSIDPEQTVNFQTVKHGFLSACILAYSHHHHLTIKPEDIWFAIQMQFNLFVNAHGEELRDKFVSHEGQKEIEIVYYGGGNRYNFDFGIFARDMARRLEENVKDPSLREWILPDFCTTTTNDSVIGSIIMMSTLQKYFSYKCTLTCGIPSVTLLGEKSDYEIILRRLNKLQAFGKEPAQFGKLLRPVLRQFIATFDKPDSLDVIKVWQQIYHHIPNGSGADHFSGWISAFSFWDDKGKCLYHVPEPAKLEESARWNGAYLILDDIIYHHVSIDDQPSGWCKVPVKINDGEEKMDAWMIGGSVGLSYEESSGGRGLDSVEAHNGLFIFTGGFIKGT